MFKRSLFFVLTALMCMSFAGCGDKPELTESAESSITEDDVESEITEEATEEITEEVDIKTDVINNVTYIVKGYLSSSAVFEGGPHNYTFSDFSVVVDSSYDYTVDFEDAESIAVLASNYSSEKEVNGFTVSDLSSDSIKIENLDRNGVVISFNTISETGMTIYYKTVMFNTGESIMFAEFSSFYDDREEVVNREFEEFINTLSEQ